MIPKKSSLMVPMANMALASTRVPTILKRTELPGDILEFDGSSLKYEGGIVVLS